MPKNLQNTWGIRSLALMAWLLAGASTLYWGIRLTSAPAKFTATTVSTPPTPQADALAVTRMLGAKSADITTPLITSLSSRLLLLGVLADKSGAGAALIAVDSKPPKPFRVGSEVSEGYQLQSVRPRVATLARDTDSLAKITLEMAPLKR